MENFCLLEVDVNGQEIFLVDKTILTSFSGRLRKLFSKLTGKTIRLKLIFDKFPGGAECFELVVKFCYNGGRIKITPFNMFQLHCAANYLEMNQEMQGKPNLVEQTISFFQKTHYMTWSELIIGLENCQELIFFKPSSSLLQEFLDCVVGRLEFHYISSPFASSSDSSSMQFSGDISTESRGIYTSQATWWFADLGFLNLNMFKKIIETMIRNKLDHSVISSFLFYYKRVKCSSASLVQKCRIIETVTEFLSSLDGSFMSIRGLFDILQLSLTLKVNKCSIGKLEQLIGSQIDRAKLDDLLIPSPAGEKVAYNVNLILRLLDIFLSNSREKILMYQLKKVAELIDLYIMEVAPDPCLKPSKFLALVMAMPDIARESNDKIYLAMDMYLKVHNGLSEEEKIKMYSVLNYDKLREETLKDLAQNESFPTCALFKAQVTLQNRPRYSVTRTSNFF
ncbi:BTB/POZ domain-containing protein At3g22104-like [Lycium barbarum]|uniref:BTB/POZ domain-containing protein At3g22104-like n=1 Tax=Lycium barbarum TaxID=112863 RepID=UPI00293E0CFC|nr:BTB/POZ domain-containing protein At3g22104-like [Lycium barbarum]